MIHPLFRSLNLCEKKGRRLSLYPRAALVWPIIAQALTLVPAASTMISTWPPWVLPVSVHAYYNYEHAIAEVCVRLISRNALRLLNCERNVL